jgi:Leucine-rich repeat (LRR) protein
MDVKLQSRGFGEKKHMTLRSMNLALNMLQRMPPALEKSLQFLNISYNKLKSLNGIEACINLKFLNASHNLISSLNGIVIL